MSAAVVSQALPLWGFAGAEIQLIAQRENSVYRVDVKGKRYALRLHRLGYRTDAELRSELAWMNALSEAGLTVPRAIASTNGNHVETVAGVQVDILSWVKGQPFGQRGQPLTLRNRPATFRQFGAELARLHALSDAWQAPAGFARSAWDREGLVGHQPQWGRFWENPALDGEQARLFLEARNNIASQLAAWDNLDYGLIHADLVPENVMIEDDQLTFIDFDDSGPGYRLYDIATALLRHREEADYAELADAFLSGYEATRPLQRDRLPLFFVAKACAYVGWSKDRMHEPANAARNARFIATAMPLVKDWLATL